METILDWLKGGDLRSDGAADQAVEAVLAHEELFDDLAEGLKSQDDVVCGRAADALEKVARRRPDLMASQLPLVLESLKTEKVPMVKWHLAMALGHLAVFEALIPQIYPPLLELLEDPSVFVKSWAIVSLCIIARQYPEYREVTANKIAPLKGDKSIAIRSKVRSALEILTDDEKSFPKGWVKSEHIRL